MKILSTPLHITGFWRCHITEDPITSGSTGAGLLLKPRAQVHGIIESRKWELLVNRVPVNMPPVNKALKIAEEKFQLERRGKIFLKTPAPIGAGYAISAASTILAVISALVFNNVKFTIEGAARIAHIAEVEERSGLGDVISMVYGGPLEIRVRPGAPGIGYVERIPVFDDVLALCFDMGKYDTRRMLEELESRINIVGKPLPFMLVENPSLRRFLELSEKFSLELGFLEEGLARQIKKIKGVVGLYVKKGVLVVIADRSYSRSVKTEVEEITGIKGRIFELDCDGVKWG